MIINGFDSSVAHTYMTPELNSFLNVETVETTVRSNLNPNPEKMVIK